MDRRRVVVTGLGWVTSLGTDVEEVFSKLLAGTSGIKPIERFDASTYAVRFGGEVSQYTPRNIDVREAKRLDRFGQFALDAAIDAVKDSGLDFEKEDEWRCGSIIGSGIGGMEEFEAGYQKMLSKGHERVSPFMVPKLMCNAACGNVSIYYHLKGPNTAVTSACASGGHAIAAAIDAIRSDSADIMVTGGSEAALTPLGTACFIALKALSRRNDDPQGASRPWDKDRDGFILSEGAGILVLEEYEHAKARGAKIYCEMLGHGASADGSHITAPDPEGRGGSHAMDSAIRNGRLEPTAVDYINAHGTSTELGDLAETNGIKLSFGDHARKLQISSTKSMTGHLLGASGGVEAIITAKTVQTGKICPTINLHQPDEGCDLDYVPNVAREADVKVALSNSFGFGGHNVSLAFGKV